MSLKYIIFMGKLLSKYGVVFLLLVITGCAKRGTITGGLKDTLGPVLRYSVPKNFSTNFDSKEIKLYFNEYVKLKDINKQLIVSPPMNTAPQISPMTASKSITIRIKDTLLPNTTYSMNFGQSIQDNNEGNPYQQFKYVFSTGSYIDSLSVQGTIKDAIKLKPDNFVSVMLYEVNEKYTDSTVYKQKPRYVTNTLDSLKTWKIENIKAGKYVLIALKDLNSNFKFDPKTEKIGFHTEEITVPSNASYELKLSQEVVPFKTYKPYQASGNRAIMGYEGDPKNVKVVLRNGREILPAMVTQLPDKDSLQIWFNKIKVDSLYLTVSKEKYEKTFSFRIKDQRKDTLSLSAAPAGTLDFRETFTITASIPLVKFDNSKITLRNKDSVAVDFKTSYDEFNQKISFDFKKEPLQKYTCTILPGAFTDFFGQANDTLVHSMATKDLSEYGNVRMRLQNIKQFPIIVELTNEKGDILATAYSENDPVINFEGVKPNKFNIRVIYDTNKNRIWDPGSLIEKRQAEEVIYFPDIPVRANWDVDQSFDLGR